MTKISIQGSSTGGGGGSGTVTSVALTTGTSGTNVNVSGSPITTSGTITVNIPIASAVNTGKLSSTDFIAFNAKQAAISLTTTGTSGAATFIANTLNIPQYAGTVTSVALASGTTGTDVNVTGSPITGSGTITVNIPIASAVNTGKLSSTDFIAFNAKQAAISLTTTGTSGAATFIANTLNIPQYATSPAGTDGQVQYNNGGAFGGDAAFNWDDTNKRLGLGTATPIGLLHLKTTAATTRQVIDSDAGQSRVISYRTSGLQRFGLYVNNVLETGGNIGSNFAIRRYDDTGTFAGTPLSIIRSTGQVTIPESLTLSGSKLINFIPETNARSASFTINSTNQDTLCGAVIEATGALTITIDASVRNGFNVSVIQMTANSSTFAVTGGLTLRNRQGHTKTFGQWATVTLFRSSGNDLILAGDTAP